MSEAILDSTIDSTRIGNGERNVLDRLADAMDVILEPVASRMFALATIAVALMSVPITLDVVARFAVHKSIPGIIELEEFFMAAIVFLSLAYTHKKDGHIEIDLLTSKLSPRTAGVLRTFNGVTCTAFFALMGWRTVLATLKKVGEYSIMLKVPMWIFVALAAFGLFVLMLVILQQTLRSLSRNVRDGAWLGIVLALVAGVVVLAAPLWIKSLPVRPSRLCLGSLGMAFMMVLLLLGMPIGFAMGVVGFIGLGSLGFSLTPALNTLGLAPYATAASFILAVAPLFILMGLLASEAGISKDLFDTAYKWLGRLPGGLAIAAVAGCSGFAAVCGDSMATAVTMGSVALPEMRQKKYKPSLACGALAAGGTLGILIPPSVGFIFYAIVTEESVGKLFIAGLMPGLMMAAMFIVSIMLIAMVRPDIAPRGEAVSFGEKLRSLKGILGMLSLFILILGGILSGVFSPTEGGAIGVVGSFAIMIIRRRLTWEGLVRACEQTVLITSKLLMILIGVGILGYFLAASRLPFDLAGVITSHGLDKYAVLAGIIGLYMVLGCLMNVIPMILLTLPAIFPTVQALGFDPVWFGVLTVIIMEMGQITPPIGVNVFALSSVAKDVPMGTIFIGIIPFFICMVLSLVLLIAFPGIATGLVSLCF
ncbi:tripartite ATP-independent transporter DctM subunit [Desulfobaculum xiamenense]|uniref:Tripartite ATP-independent transporter DctM subunit n=1 Tax=Desulfobaculum xiamenense TaxID=995050 RepID=A0A846QS40_9BACT|nr:TRAP transporter large permease subunit [Desulfobaculum xiamenense]NJB67994.1 tripartite ATP-independent transporter DctM subunit [Desulfobaculum xiamenense]